MIKEKERKNENKIEEASEIISGFERLGFIYHETKIK